MRRKSFNLVLVIFILTVLFLLLSCKNLEFTLKNEQIKLNNNILINILNDKIEILSDGKAFLSFSKDFSFINAFEKNYTYDYHMASIKIKEKVIKSYTFQNISKIDKNDEYIIIEGYLSQSKNLNDKVPYNLKIYSKSENRIDFKLNIEDKNINEINLKFLSKADERIFGGGVQYSFLDLKGKKVPILTSEQGVGRGDQPITFGANLTSKAGGDNFTTYFPIPFFFTSKLRAFYFENTGYGEFNFSNPNFVDVKFITDKETNMLSGSFFVGNSYKEIISTFS